MVVCHCGEPAEWSCTRGILWYVRVYVKDLRPDDSICRFNEPAPKRGTSATVDSLVPIGHLGRLRLTFTIYRQGKPPSTRTYDCEPDAVIRSMRPATCGVPVCENCAQDPGEPHKYCPAHWIRVESIAA